MQARKDNFIGHINMIFNYYCLMIFLFLLLMLFYLIYIEKLLFLIPWNFFINNSMELKKIIIIKIHEYLK